MLTLYARNVRLGHGIIGINLAWDMLWGLLAPVDGLLHGVVKIGVHSWTFCLYYSYHEGREVVGEPMLLMNCFSSPHSLLCVCKHTHTCAEIHIGCLPQSLLTLFLNQVLSLNLERIDSARLAGQRAACLCLSVTWGYRYRLPHLAFYKNIGDPESGLCSKCFID